LDNQSRKWQAWLLWLIPLSFILVFFYQPLAAIFRLVFSDQFASGWQSFNSQQVLKPLGFTIWQALLSTLLTLLLGLPAAYIFSHFKFAGSRALRSLSLVPFILPTVVAAAAFNALLGPNGWLNLAAMRLFQLSTPPLKVLNSLPAILLVHVFYNISIIIRIVGSAWGRLSERLSQAATMLGASPLQRFKRVTLPLLSPAILGAALLVFLFDFTSFGVVLMLGGPGFATLEVEIYTQTMMYLNLPVAGLLSIVQLAFTLLLTFLYNRMTQQRFGKFALASEERNLRKPKKRLEKLGVIVLSIILVVLILLPLLSLAARSMFILDAARGERGEVKTGFTLAYYRMLFENPTGSLFYVPPIRAIHNSLGYALATVLLTTVIGILTAYAVVRSGRMSRWVEPFISLPLGTSAVTMGLGFIVVFNHPPWMNTKFPFLIPIAHTLIALPLSLHTLLPALRGIPETLRQSARVMGANPWQVFSKVDLPILLRAVLVSMVFSLTVSLGEFGAASFLSSVQRPTVPIAIYRYISMPGSTNYGQALAMSTLLMLVCIGGVFLIEKIKLPGEELF